MKTTLKLALTAAALTAAQDLWAEIPTPEPTFLTPGLLQGRLAGQFNIEDSILKSDIAIRRELGPIMGLFHTSPNGNNQYGYYQSEIDAFRTYWDFNVTFIYVGRIYLDSTKVYAFGSRIDDSGYLKIGNQILYSYNGGGACKQVKYEPAYTGWYPVEIRCGNGAGMAGRNSPYCAIGKIGFVYCMADKGSVEAETIHAHTCSSSVAEPKWIKLIDDGTGNLFGTSPQTGLLDAVKVTFIGKDGQELRASVRADIAEKVNIYAWYGPEYGGAVKADWAHEQWIGRTTGTAGETLNAAFQFPADTQYIRFVAIGAEDGTHKWAGETQSVSEIGPIVFAPQATCTVDPETATTFSATVKVDVTYPGFGANDWTAVLTYGGSGRAEVSGTGAESKTIALENLLGGAAIPATLTITSDTGRTTVVEDVVIQTTAESSLGLLPGLMQGKLEGSRNLTDGMSASITDVRRELGPVMGLYTDKSGGATPYTSELDGVKSYWGNNVTYLYVGRIWLDATKTYAFGGRNDDSVDLSIDGEKVLATTGCKVTTYKPTYTGWHALEIRSGNGAGWAGANPYCPIGYKGIVYNAEGKTDHTCQNTHEDEDWWIPLKDTGDATLLATPGVTAASDQIAFAMMERRPESFVAEVDLKMSDPVKVYAWTGATYGGVDEAAWTSKTGVLATKTVDGVKTGVKIKVPLQAGDKFVRLVAVSTRDESVVWTSPTVPLDGLELSRHGLVIVVR